jgi:hypothetical protein
VLSPHFNLELNDQGVGFGGVNEIPKLDDQGIGFSGIDEIPKLDYEGVWLCNQGML